MKATDLLKYVTKNKVEYHWHDDDVILMPNISQISEFNKLLSGSIYDDDGIDCKMKDGYFCFHMQDICDYFGIDLEDIFEEKDPNL